MLSRGQSRVISRSEFPTLPRRRRLREKLERRAFRTVHDGNAARTGGSSRPSSRAPLSSLPQPDFPANPGAAYPRELSARRCSSYFHSRGLYRGLLHARAAARATPHDGRSRRRRGEAKEPTRSRAGVLHVASLIYEDGETEIRSVFTRYLISCSCPTIDSRIQI